MSDRVDINDIQSFLRHTNVEDYLKTDKEKAAYKRYQDIYHELLNTEYKKSSYMDLYSNIRFTHHSQETIDSVKEIVELDRDIQKLEFQLETMEQSKLFQNIHHRVLYGLSSKFNLKEKLYDTLGSKGFILYFLIRLFISVLPFVMIGKGFIWTMIFTGIAMFFPLSSVVFWIWGLICTINGIQDAFAIIYYIAFVVLWMPFFISTIRMFFDNK